MEIGRFAVALVGHFLASLLYVLQKLHLVEAVVDTSSILEHREELRELWEKRMMADENQSSSSSTVTETVKTSPKEEESEEKVAKSKSEPENHDHKMSNGYVKHDDQAENAREEAAEGTKISNTTGAHFDENDNENNNSADSLEEDNIEDFIEEKTYISTLEKTLVMKESIQVKEEISVVSQEVHEAEITTESKELSETVDIITRSDTVDSKEHEYQAISENKEVDQAISKKDSLDSKEVVDERTTEELQKEEILVTENSSFYAKESYESVPEPPIVNEVAGDDDDDGFVRVEECLPKVEGEEDDEEDINLPHDEQSDGGNDASSTNGYGELTSPSPVAAVSGEKPPSHPEMEQFVKAGGVKRIIPGVQKTEQPYSSCTTETKIAMEIREMREREEELRIMREQALLSPTVSPVPPVVRSPSPAMKESATPSPTPQGPGYRVSSVFGRGTVSPSLSIDEEKKFKGFNKESAVEKEIRLAKDREEELRKQKGLPPREDDSYVKPSQVKSSQVRVFGKAAGANTNSVKNAATTKIQMEIEEQTQREMALRETGHIQTISQERTDSKVAKLNANENNAPVHTNGNTHAFVNGSPYSNGRSSPDVGYKRSSPSPTNARPASIFSQNGVKGNISMHKFIASKGKETAFVAPRNGPFQVPKEDCPINRSAVPPAMVKLKRNVSVESKIQQEILEMKQREEELKKLHMNLTNGNSTVQASDSEQEMNQKNNSECENGNGIHEEDVSPRHNKLIAQWEQRIQKAES